MTGYLDPIRVAPNATVAAQAATATLVAADVNGKIQTNTGSSGTIVLTLPSAADAAGCAFIAAVTAAQIIQLLPVTGEKIYLNGSGVASKYLNIAAVISNFAELYSDGASWLVTRYSGVVTKEA